MTIPFSIPNVVAESMYGFISGVASSVAAAIITVIIAAAVKRKNPMPASKKTAYIVSQLFNSAFSWTILGVSFVFSVVFWTIIGTIPAPMPWWAIGVAAFSFCWMSIPFSYWVGFLSYLRMQQAEINWEISELGRSRVKALEEENARLKAELDNRSR